MTSMKPTTELDLTGMLAAHRAMRVEYGRLAAVTAEPRDPSHAALIDDQIAVYLELLHQHHQVEDDDIWPRLRTRVPEAVAQLDMLEAQHDEIDPLIGVAVDRTLPRRERAAALAALDALLNTHLDDEERMALPLIKAHITPQEWEVAEDAVIRTMSPKQRKVVFGAGAVDASPEEFAQLMTLLPAPIRVLVRLSWMPACRRRRRRLYGTTGR